MSLRRHPDFLRLWAGETISVLGSQVTLLAVPFVAITLLDASTFEVGLLTAIETLPFLLVGLPAGAVIDRVRRRPVMIVADFGRAAALTSIPIAHAFDALTLAQLYVVVLVTGVLTVFFDVAYQAYLPSVVARDQLVEGNAKLAMSQSAAQVAGPGLAGGLVGWIGAVAAIWADAASFVLSALALLGIRHREPRAGAAADADGAEPAGDPTQPEQPRRPGPRVQPGGRPRLRTAVAEGLRYVWHHPLLRPIAACTGTTNLFGSMWNAVLILFAVRELGMSAGQVGIAFAVGNIGFLVGTLLTARVTARIGVGRAIVGAAFVGGLGFWLAVPATPATGTLAVVAANAVVGLGVPAYNINQVSLRQAITPDRLQGRLHATMRFLVWGTMPVGALLGGALGTLVGLRATLAVAAVGTSLAFLWVALSPVRSVATIPDGPVSVGEELGDAAPGVGGILTPLSGPAGAADDTVLGAGDEDDLDVR